MRERMELAMITLKSAILSAFGSLLHGRSFLQALFAVWIGPFSLRERGKWTADQTPSLSYLTPRRKLDDFIQGAGSLFIDPIQTDQLRHFATQLKKQFRERLHSHTESMLPSYSHLLPTGREKGRFLALDVGGSTLRVALVELRGREMVGRETEIVRMSMFKITAEIKKLEGMEFFNWMAEKMDEVIRDQVTPHDMNESTSQPLPLGLAWSFAVDQTSCGGGRLLGMGKAFMATKGLLGRDIGELISTACADRGLKVELQTVVNDSSATLLSQAYSQDSTRFGLILGTGSNIAVHLPVSAFDRSKFGNRPESWFTTASHVIVNTELGMFGKGILPMTRWDENLNAAHPLPDFQPLEYLLSGFYLGEICRLAIIDAVEIAGLLGSVVPPSLVKPYSLDAETLSIMESDNTSNLETATSCFTTRHPCPVRPTRADISAIRTLAQMISQRSSALLAAAVFALWELRHETEAEYHQQSLSLPPRSSSSSHSPSKIPFMAKTPTKNDLATKVAYNGSVIERYPGYRAHCQDLINELVAQSTVKGDGEAIELVPAIESSILGAAVSLACNTRTEAGVEKEEA